VIDVRAARLVAAREVREQMRGRALWISSAITVVAVCLLIVLPTVLAGGPPTYRVGITPSASDTVKAAVTAAVRSTGANVELVPIADRAAAAAALQAKGSTHLDIAVLSAGGGAVLLDRALPPGSTQGKSLAAQAVARAVSVADAIAAHDVAPATAKALTDPTPLPIDHLRPAPTSKGERAVALVGSIVFYILVLSYGMRLVTGVVQEKATRVIEVILSALRPVDLLAGKVVGSSLLAFGQAAALAVAALVSAHAVGSDVLAGSGGADIAVAFVWIVLGFFLYATLFTAVGALASKAEDAQSVSLPLQIPLLVGYLASFTVLGSDTPSTFVRVLAYIPFTAPMDMPVLAATGGATPWQIAVSMLLTLASIGLMVRLAAVLFNRSVLRTGQRLKARDVLRERSGVPSTT
jgi:ABC-2 type transport system permease protein